MVLQPCGSLHTGCRISFSLLETLKNVIASSKKGICIFHPNLWKLRIMLGSVIAACLLWAAASAIDNNGILGVLTETDVGSFDDHAEKLYKAEGDKKFLYVPRRLDSGNHGADLRLAIGASFTVLVALIFLMLRRYSPTFESWIQWGLRIQSIGAAPEYKTLQTADDSVYVQGAITTRIAVMGSVGVGKSQLLNALLRTNKFEAAHQAESVTQKTEAAELQIKLYWSGEAVTVRLIDTPGAGDASGALLAQQYRNQMFEIFREEGTLNAVILVLNYKAPRLTEGMSELLLDVKEAFGEDLFDYLFLVWTHYRAKEDEVEDKEDKQKVIDDWTKQLSATWQLTIGHKLKFFFVDCIDALRDDKVIADMKGNGDDLSICRAAAWTRLKDTSLNELSRILKEAENNARCDKAYVTKQLGAPRIHGFAIEHKEWYIDEQLPDRACILQVSHADPRYSKLKVHNRSEGLQSLQVKQTQDKLSWQLAWEKVPYFDTTNAFIEVEVVNKNADPHRATLSFKEVSVDYRPQRRSKLLAELKGILSAQVPQLPDDLKEHEAKSFLSNHVRVQFIDEKKVREPQLRTQIEEEVKLVVAQYSEEQKLKSRGAIGVIRAFERRHRCLFWFFVVFIIGALIYGQRLILWVRAGGDCANVPCRGLGQTRKLHPLICSLKNGPDVRTHYLNLLTRMNVCKIGQSILYPNCSADYCCHPRSCLCDHGIPGTNCPHHDDHLCAACNQHLRLSDGNKSCIPMRGYTWTYAEIGDGTRIQMVRALRCRCDNGFPASGESCPFDGARVCDMCEEHFKLSVDHDRCGPQKGYHHTENGLMMNLCRCHYGTAASGADCPNPGAPKCIACQNHSHLLSSYQCAPDEGYHVHRTMKASKVVLEVIQTNMCKCKNGAAAVGKACPTDGQPLCAACSDFFVLADSSKACVPKQGWHLEEGMLAPNHCTCMLGIGAVGMQCPLDGDMGCAACLPHARLVGTGCREEPGYHFDKLIAAMRANVCKCAFGIPSVGRACPEHKRPGCSACDEFAHLANGNNRCVPDPGYHLSPGGNSIQENICSCKQGVPGRGKECKVDRGKYCRACNRHGERLGGVAESGECIAKKGYFLDPAGGLFSMNVCRCPAGAPATAESCLHNGMYFCSSCPRHMELQGGKCLPKEGFEVSRTGVVATTCTCDHGIAAFSVECPEQGHIKCLSCFHPFKLSGDDCRIMPGYHLEADSATANVCTCNHGVPADTGDCLIDKEPKCIACNAFFHLTEPGRACIIEKGYHLANGQARENVCKCLHGIGERGKTCPSHGAALCKECRLNFELDKGSCV